MNLASLFVKVGLTGQGSVVSGLEGIKKSALASKAGLAAVVGALYAINKVARDTAVSLDKYVTFTGRSAEELQALSFQAAQTGVSMDQLSSQIQAMEKQRVDTMLGKGFDPAYVLLGIDPTIDPIERFKKIREAIANTADPNVAKSLITQLGISEDMYYFLSQDTKALDDFGKKLIITDKERFNLVKMNKEWNILFYYIKQIGIKLQAMNTGWISDIIQAITTVVRFFGDWAVRISELVQKNDSLKVVLAALATVIAPVITKFIALLAVVEDFINYLDGADSVLGRFGSYLDKYFGDYVRGAIQLFKDLFSWVDKTFGLVEKFINLWNTIKDSAGGQFVANMWEALKMGIKEIASDEHNSAGRDTWSDIVKGPQYQMSTAGLAPNVQLASDMNTTITVNNNNNFNGYSADEIRPEITNITEKDISDAQMVSAENAENI